MIEVGVLQVTLHLTSSHSLKEKRHVVRSIKDRLRGRFNISIAEVDDQDVWQTITLGVATVSNDAKHISGLLQQIVNQLRLHPEAQLVDHQIEIM